MGRARGLSVLGPLPGSLCDEGWQQGINKASVPLPLLPYPSATTPGPDLPEATLCLIHLWRPQASLCPGSQWLTILAVH